MHVIATTNLFVTCCQSVGMRYNFWLKASADWYFTTTLSGWNRNSETSSWILLNPYMDTSKFFQQPVPPASPWRPCRYCLFHHCSPCNLFSFNTRLCGTSAAPKAGSLHPSAFIRQVFSGKISQCVHWFSATYFSLFFLLCCLKELYCSMRLISNSIDDVFWGHFCSHLFFRVPVEDLDCNCQAG